MKKRILLYISNCEQIDLVYPLIAENIDINYGIIIHNADYDTFLRSSLGALKNIDFINAQQLNAAALTIYGMFISTDTRFKNGSTVLPLLLKTFYSLNVPIVDLQCDLLIGDKNEKLSVSSHSFRWFNTGEDNCVNIGYPISESAAKNMQGEYILVITDFENKNYSDKDISCFCHSIYEYAREHTGASIIWKMIDSDYNRTLTAIKHFRTFYNTKANKVYFCNEEEVLSMIPLTELIAKANLVITTFTMPRLLDCELNQIPVAVFSGTTVEAPVIDAENITTFKNAKDLEYAIFDNDCQKLSSGILNKYDNSAYISAVERLYVEPAVVDKKLYIDTILATQIFSKYRPTFVSESVSTPNSENNANHHIEYLQRKTKKDFRRMRKMIIAIAIEAVIILLLFSLLLF